MSDVKRSASRRVVVTGGAGGIGSAITHDLAASGWTVGFMDLDEARLSSVSRELGGRHMALKADVRDPSAVQSAIEGFVSREGDLQGVVLAAAIASTGSVRDTSMETWLETIEVNLTGSFLVAQACLRFMAQGSIVMVSSVQALAGWARQAAYAASKGGLVALARQMAVDLASDGIRVNVVCPGTIDTPMLRGKQAVDADLEHQWKTQQPIQRIGVPSDVAGITHFLMSEDASWITGQVFVVDGGLLGAGARG